MADRTEIAFLPSTLTDQWVSCEDQNELTSILEDVFNNYSQVDEAERQHYHQTDFLVAIKLLMKNLQTEITPVRIMVIKLLEIFLMDSWKPFQTVIRVLFSKIQSFFNDSNAVLRNTAIRFAACLVTRIDITHTIDSLVSIIGNLNIPMYYQQQLKSIHNLHRIISIALLNITAHNSHYSRNHMYNRHQNPSSAKESGLQQKTNSTYLKSAIINIVDNVMKFIIDHHPLPDSNSSQWSTSQRSDKLSSSLSITSSNPLNVSIETEDESVIDLLCTSYIALHTIDTGNSSSSSNSISSNSSTSSQTSKSRISGKSEYFLDKVNFEQSVILLVTQSFQNFQMSQKKNISQLEEYLNRIKDSIQKRVEDFNFPSLTKGRSAVLAPIVEVMLMSIRKHFNITKQTVALNESSLTISDRAPPVHTPRRKKDEASSSFSNLSLEETRSSFGSIGSKTLVSTEPTEGVTLFSLSAPAVLNIPKPSTDPITLSPTPNSTTTETAKTIANDSTISIQQKRSSHNQSPSDESVISEMSKSQFDRFDEKSTSFRSSKPAANSSRLTLSSHSDDAISLLSSSSNSDGKKSPLSPKQIVQSKFQPVDISQYRKVKQDHHNKHDSTQPPNPNSMYFPSWSADDADSNIIGNKSKVFDQGINLTPRNPDVIMTPRDVDSNASVMMKSPLQLKGSEIPFSNPNLDSEWRSSPNLSRSFSGGLETGEEFTMDSLSSKLLPAFSPENSKIANLKQKRPVMIRSASLKDSLTILDSPNSHSGEAPLLGSPEVRRSVSDRQYDRNSGEYTEIQNKDEWVASDATHNSIESPKMKPMRANESFQSARVDDIEQNLQNKINLPIGKSLADDNSFLTPRERIDQPALDEYSTGAIDEFHSPMVRPFKTPNAIAKYHTDGQRVQELQVPAELRPPEARTRRTRLQYNNRADIGNQSNIRVAQSANPSLISLNSSDAFKNQMNFANEFTSDPFMKSNNLITFDSVPDEMLNDGESSNYEYIPFSSHQSTKEEYNRDKKPSHAAQVHLTVQGSSINHNAREPKQSRNVSMLKQSFSKNSSGFQALVDSGDAFGNGGGNSPVHAKTQEKKGVMKKDLKTEELPQNQVDLFQDDSDSGFEKKVVSVNRHNKQRKIDQPPPLNHSNNAKHEESPGNSKLQPFRMDSDSEVEAGLRNKSNNSPYSSDDHTPQSVMSPLPSSVEYLTSEQIQPSAKPLQEFTKSLAGLEVQEWPEIFNTLNSIRSIALHHPSIITNSGTLHNMMVLINKQADNLRSSVAKNALLCIADILKGLGKNADSEIPTIIGGILKRCGDTSNSFLAESAGNTLNCMIESVSPIRSLQGLLNNVEHKNASIRGKVAVYLHVLLQQKSNDLLGTKELDVMKSKLAKLIRDQSPEARSASREIVNLLLNKKMCTREELESFIPSDMVEKALKSAQSFSQYNSPSRIPAGSNQSLQGRAGSSFRRNNSPIVQGANKYSDSPMGNNSSQSRMARSNLAISSSPMKNNPSASNEQQSSFLYEKNNDKSKISRNLKKVEVIDASIDSLTYSPNVVGGLIDGEVTDDDDEKNEDDGSVAVKGRLRRFSIGSDGEEFDKSKAHQVGRDSNSGMKGKRTALDKKPTEPKEMQSDNNDKASKNQSSYDIGTDLKAISSPGLPPAHPINSKSKGSSNSQAVSAAKRMMESDPELQNLPALQQATLTKSWTERKDALTNLTNVMIRHGSVLKEAGKLNACIDCLLERLDDGSVKIIQHTIFCLEMIVKEEPSILQHNILTIIGPALLNSASSSNKTISQSSLVLLRNLLSPVAPAQVTQFLCNIALHDKEKLKLIALRFLGEYVLTLGSGLDSSSTSFFKKSVFPSLCQIIFSSSTKGDIRVTATETLKSLQQCVPNDKIWLWVDDSKQQDELKRLTFAT